MRSRRSHAVSAAVGLALVAVTVVVLLCELRAISWPVLAADILSTPMWRLGAAALLTTLNYAVLAAYDVIAFSYLGRACEWWRVAVVSAVSYAMANNVGFPFVSGASVRYRFYTRWGLSGDELARIVLVNTATFWLGVLAMGGVGLVRGWWADLWPAAGVPGWLGWPVMGACAAYVAGARWRRPCLRVGRFEVPLPSVRLALAQLAASSLEWILAAAVLYVLLPRGGAPFPTVLSAFLIAQIAGLASHVPGGAGVLESLLVLMLKPYWAPGQLIPALVVYRAVYSMLPLAAALAALTGDTIGRRQPAAPAASLSGSASRSPVRRGRTPPASSRRPS